MKKISIIIACYNHGKFLEKSVKSALDQDYKNLEIIIIDDGSTDDSFKVATRLKQDHPSLIVITQSNTGVIVARNNAIELSTGEYILPLDADDYLASNDVVSAMMSHLEKERVEMVFGNYQLFGDAIHHVKPENKGLASLLIDNFISATALFSKEIFNKVGKYKEYMKDGFEDWEFNIRFLNAAPVAKIEKTIFFYRVQKKSRNIEATKKSKNLRNIIIKNNREIYVKNIVRIMNFLNKKNENLYKKITTKKRQNFTLKILLILQLILIIFLMI